MSFDWPEPITSPIVRRAADILPDHLVHYAAGGVFLECPICPGPAYDGTYTVDGFKLDACRTCAAPIVWATTEDGKSMPVDGPFTPGGNVVLSAPTTNVPSEPVIAVVLDQDGLFGDGPRRVSHFATCPDADTWRTRRAKS